MLYVFNHCSTILQFVSTIDTNYYRPRVHLSLNKSVYLSVGRSVYDLWQWRSHDSGRGAGRDFQAFRRNKYLLCMAKKRRRRIKLHPFVGYFFLLPLSKKTTQRFCTNPMAGSSPNRGLGFLGKFPPPPRLRH